MNKKQGTGRDTFVQQVTRAGVLDGYDAGLEAAAKIADVSLTAERREQLTTGFGAIFTPEQAYVLACKTIAGDIRRALAAGATKIKEV